MDITEPAIALPSLGAAPNKVYRIGVELEGLWERLPAGTRLVRDGSVSFNDSSEPPSHIGELPSRVMTPGELPEWLRSAYPSRVNASCGMHVHMSFEKVGTYIALMKPDFTATTLRYMREWANSKHLPFDDPFWKRLAGQSGFCEHKFYADEQVKATSKSYSHAGGGSRYTVWNYAYERYNTVECRLLSMMADAETAISAISRLQEIVNAYVEATEATPQSWSISEPVPVSGELQEESVELI